MPPMGEFLEFLKVYSHDLPIRVIRVKEFLDLEKTMIGVGLCLIVMTIFFYNLPE
jgi:hypothetical protein